MRLNKANYEQNNNSVSPYWEKLIDRNKNYTTGYSTIKNLRI